MNINHKNADVRLFEFGNTYRLNSSGVTDVVEKYPEMMMLEVVLSGKYEPENWKSASQNIDFYDLKKLVLNLLKKAGIDAGEMTSQEGETLLRDNPKELAKRIDAMLAASGDTLKQLSFEKIEPIPIKFNVATSK